jgi:hypothetical protein
VVVIVLMGWEDMVESRDDGNVGWYPASPVGGEIQMPPHLRVSTSCPTPPWNAISHGSNHACIQQLLDWYRMEHAEEGAYPARLEAVGVLWCA